MSFSQAFFLWFILLGVFCWANYRFWNYIEPRREDENAD